jgi:PAS domain S-box-containing protein
VATIILSALYLIFPILVFLEEKLVKSKIEVKESEEKYQLISENANDLIAILNDKYKYEYVNEQAYLKLLGYSKNQLIGKSVWEHVHPEDLEKMVNSQQLSVDGFQAMEGEDNAELRIKHKNGLYRWIEYTSKVFINSEGNPNVIVISRDITERKKAEEELKESEEQFRTITEQSFMGIIIIQDGDIKYVNEVVSKILEYNLQVIRKWSSEDFFKIIHPLDLTIAMKRFRRMDTGRIGTLGSSLFRIFTKSRTIKWIEINSKIIQYQGKNAIMVTLVDVTTKKEAEQLIIEENQKLVELDNLRKELITRISHELRTPLTSMYAASQILLRSNKEDTIEKIYPYLEISHHGSIRLKELIENLLDTSKIENKKFELRPSNENINSIIKDCVKELNYLAKNRQVALNVDLTMDVYFNLDKHRFPQALINIISNALKNTPPKGMVYISLNETNEYIDIIIKDTGVGLTQEEKGKLFQKFGKIERSGMELDVDIEGAGLGLYISKEIVELHGGQIIVESEGRHKGSSFIIRLNK